MLLLRASASSTYLETRTRSSRSARLGTQVTEDKSDRSTCQIRQPLTPGGPRAARKHRERTACVLSIASNRFKSRHKNRTYPPQIGFLQLLSSAVPGAAPPTESVSDVKSSKLLSNVSSSSKILYSRKKWCKRAKAFVFADGNRAWKSVCGTMKIPFAQVSHGRMVYAQDLPRKRPGQCKMAGTQTLEQVWRHLKRYVPYTLALKRPTGSGLKLNPRLLQYCFSFMFRLNAQKQLWTELSRLADSKNTRRSQKKTTQKGVPTEIRFANLQIYHENQCFIASTKLMYSKHPKQAV